MLLPFIGFLDRLLSLMVYQEECTPELKDWVLEKANADVAEGVRYEFKPTPNGFVICINTVANSLALGMFENCNHQLFLLYRFDSIVTKPLFTDQDRACELYNDVLDYLTRPAIQ